MHELHHICVFFTSFQVCVWPDLDGKPRSAGYSGNRARIRAAHQAASGPAGDHGAAGAVWRERKT